MEGLVATLLVALGIVLGAFTAAANCDPFDQASFPCQEDEVLGYAPEFGPDKVGCIHIDNLR
ncbi:hypothetical protein SHEEN_83 [Mycobacterium phage Sheen]|uniref:Uncharacterized protein n=1 Tax=Mycobacterium phage Sheen TaxID=1589274 RepID=A0A0B5A603_9CAUD|nr:hypothetical protein AVV31_gp11 [Mycobacterium phage Sheen]AJD82501.1 hypothetical protein SHEEN_83 [Mycobacterium phage Sheen]